MRSVVYNRYWGTGGGAEKYGGVIAELLAARGPVRLATHEPFDIDWLAERLQLDLSGAEVLLIEDAPRAITEVGADADLFVNVSFMSRDRAPHRRSIYIVHFPTSLDAHLPRWRRSLAHRSHWLRARSLPVSFSWGEGFHHREGGRRSVAWTDGDASLHLLTDPDTPIPVRLAFGFQRPAAAGPAGLRLLVDGEEVASDDLAGPVTTFERAAGRALRCTVQSPEEGVPVELRVVSERFVPADLDGGDDRRELGVPLVGIQIGGGVAGLVARVMPSLLASPLSNSFVESYGALVSNSHFTKGWVARRWDADSEVLYPPVSAQQRGEKTRTILGVGRFFPSHRGHSKKQLELVQAFRTMVDTGTAGWTLHLAGGCSDDGEEYLAEVRAAAAGYPVVLHPNAPGADLAALYGSASIYWHAAGFGVDPDKEPDVLEHFGISTVEAMSAGVVPVVLGVGGLVETVRHGIDGYHFRSLDGLVAMTRSLIDDPDQLARMSASAEARAEQFGIDAFAARLDAVIDGLPGG